MNTTTQNTVTDKLSVAHFVLETLRHCVEANASDVHFEPSFHELKIRYRKDGVFFTLSAAPISLSKPILAHLKSSANLNVAEHHKPQDGRISLEINNKLLNFRLSTMPAQFGETLVLRILDPSSLNLNLDQLGASPNIVQTIRKLAKRPHGIFIVTGPTGSGKTTTLYSLLQDIYSSTKKYLTAEDPVEYIIPGVSQISINNAIGLTFSKVLRAFLRHDPDVIMVGEIRDLETAQIAIQASLTGHLVLTTLHTNNSASAITRLIDLGLSPPLLASALQGILAQRLIRVFCSTCKGTTCLQCHHSGFLGRTGIFELMSISPTLKHLISQNAPLHVLETQTELEGTIPLSKAGTNLVNQNITSLQELNNILGL